MRNLARSIYDAIAFSAYTPKIIDRLSVRNIRAMHAKKTVDTSNRVRKAQLLVDVSVISHTDAGTGIQRMVRSVLNELKSNPPKHFDVRTIVATRKKSYRYSRGYIKELESFENTEISVRAGDAFLALDLAAHIIPSKHQQLIEWKNQGVTFHFIAYDLLPLLHKKWFSKKLALAFKRWIKEVAVLSDSVICISRSVESDLIQWFDNRYNIPNGAISTNVIPLGSDISPSITGSGFPNNFDEIISKTNKYKTALIVGTLEPRKGHLQVLKAFEKLWKKGIELNLIIVGKSGWKTQSLQKKILQNNELNNHLFWLSNASDQALLALYKSCTGVIIASYAEGYGLPLIEAIEHNKPVLARDIPIFREQKQNGIEYFSDHDVTGLDSKIHQWLSTARDLQPCKNTPHLSSWRQTSEEIIKIISKEKKPH